jgi:DNA-binding NarL/FixJ family response regulator
VDDHPMVVSGLEAALSTRPDLDVVGRGASVADARRFLGDRSIDVLLLDVRLRDGNGLAALAERGPGTHRPAVLVISSFSTSQYVAAAHRFGAVGFILKTVPLEELADAILSANKGDTLFTNDQQRSEFVALSGQERRVLELAMSGSSNKEIGRQVGMSRKGVEAHLSDLYARHSILGGRVELLIRAEREGWLEVALTSRPTRSRVTASLTASAVAPESTQRK